MKQIPAQDIRAAGHAGVVNYVSMSRPGSTMGAKPITLPYAKSLAAAGLAIVSNYQYGKPIRCARPNARPTRFRRLVDRAGPTEHGHHHIVIDNPTLITAFTLTTSLPGRPADRPQDRTAALSRQPDRDSGLPDWHPRIDQPR